ncbi:hypothetical protein [Galenea microaerophila]
MVDIINPEHEVVELEKRIDWELFEKEWFDLFPSTTGRLDRYTLKGQIGYAMFALLCAAGHNLRLILSFIRVFWLFHSRRL